MPQYLSTDPNEGDAIEVPAAEAAEQPEGSAASRFIGSAAEQLNPLPILSALGEMLVDPEAARQAGAGARQQMSEQWERAGGEFFGPDGSIIKGLGHALAGSIPLVGPAAAEIGEQIGGGDVAGGLGAATGLVGSALIPGAAARVAPKAGRVIAPIRRGFQRAELTALEPSGNLSRAVVSGLKEATTKGGLEARKAFLKEQLGVPKPHGHGAPRPKPPAPKPPTPEPEAPKLKPAAKAKLKHALARTAKEVGEEAAKVTPRASVPPARPVSSTAVKPSVPDIAPDALLSDLRARVTTMQGLGIAPADIAKSLQKAYAQQGRAEGLSVGKMRTMVDAILKESTPGARVTIRHQTGAKAAPIQAQAAKASEVAVPFRPEALKELTKNPEQLASWIREQASGAPGRPELSRGQIAAVLRENLASGAPDVGVERFRAMVDIVLGPEEKAVAQKLAQEGVGSIADKIRAQRMAENAAKAAAPRGASLLDEMTDQARTMAKSTGLTPEEMVQALKKFNPGVGDREAFAAVQRAMRGAQ